MFNGMKLRHWLDDFCRRYGLRYTVLNKMAGNYVLNFTNGKTGFVCMIDIFADSEEDIYGYIITEVFRHFTLAEDQIVKSRVFPELNSIEKVVYDRIFKKPSLLCDELRYIEEDVKATLSLYTTSKIAPVLSPQSLKLSCNISSYIEKVIFNPPATIVIWTDGTKTVVKCDIYDIYDAEKGLAMAISKRALGNEGNYYEVFKKWLPEKQESAELVCRECRYFLHNICSNRSIFNDICSDDKRRAICKGFDEKISDEDNRYLARVCLNGYIENGQLTKEDYNFSKEFKAICDEVGIKFDEDKMDLDDPCGNCLYVNDDEKTGRCKDCKAIHDTASEYKWVFNEKKVEPDYIASRQSGKTLVEYAKIKDYVENAELSFVEESGIKIADDYVDPIEKKEEDLRLCTTCKFHDPYVHQEPCISCHEEFSSLGKPHTKWEARCKEKSNVEPVTNTEEKEKALTEMFESSYRKVDDDPFIYPKGCHTCRYHDTSPDEGPCCECSVILNGDTSYFEESKIKRFGCNVCIHYTPIDERCDYYRIMGTGGLKYVSNMDECPKKENSDSEEKKETLTRPKKCSECIFENFNHYDTPCDKCSEIYNGDESFFTTIEKCPNIKKLGCEECEKLECGKISGLAACSINGRYISNMDKCPKDENKEKDSKLPETCVKCVYKRFEPHDFPCNKCSEIYRGKDSYFTNIKDYCKVGEFGCVDCEHLDICEFTDVPKCSIENKYLSYLRKCPNK